MEGIFVWIVLFAGGALLLLGVLLIASEKELKNKRREVEALLSKLEGFSEGTSSTGGASSSSNSSEELSELRADNRELEKQIAGLNSDLERSRQALQDMQASRELSGGNSPAIQELRTANERLAEERDNLAAHITELEKKLSATAQSISELDHIRTRSERAEHEQQALLEQIHQRELELAEWQSRASEAEQHRQRLAALQTPYHALVSKQAELSEKQRELQADLEAFAKLMDHRQG